MAGIARLLASDLSKVTRDELLEAIDQAETTRRAAPEWSGRLLAALHRTGMSWPQIARVTGIKQSTAHRRAEKYL